MRVRSLRETPVPSQRRLSPMKTLLLALFVVVIAAPSLMAQELSAADLDRRRKALMDLLDEHWEYTMKQNPEYASILGDKRYNAEVSDVSEAAVKKEQAETKRWLARFEAIDTRA